MLFAPHALGFLQVLWHVVLAIHTYLVFGRNYYSLVCLSVVCSLRSVKLQSAVVDDCLFEILAQLQQSVACRCFLKLFYLEFAFAILGRWNVEEAVLLLQIHQQFVECEVLHQNVGIAHHEQLQSGTCHGYIQFAVNHHSVFHEHVIGEEVELIVLLHSESVDYVVALTALVSLHRVDSYVVQYVDAMLVDGAAHSSNLVAVGHDYSYGLVLVKPFLGLSVNLDYRGSNHFRFHLIGLHRSRSPWLWSRYKRHTSHTQQLCYSVGRIRRTIW